MESTEQVQQGGLLDAWTEKNTSVTWCAVKEIDYMYSHELMWENSAYMYMLILDARKGG